MLVSDESPAPPGAFDAAGIIRRVRRVADLSQMELADVLGVAQSSVARWEAARKEPSLERLQQILAIAGLTLAAVDEAGARVPPMRGDALRDLGYRRYPAHLDLLATGGVDDLGGQIPQLGHAPRRRGRRDEYMRSAEGRRNAEDRRHDDHLTEAEVYAERREVRDRRREETRRQQQTAEEARRARGIPPSDPRCFCIDDCFLGCRCVAECPCQCDPAPGWDWGETCAFPRRPQP